MKNSIQPKKYITYIQQKDGSLYIKNWLFFKSALQLDVDVLSSAKWKQSVHKSINLPIKIKDKE